MKTVKGKFNVKGTPLENDALAQNLGAMRMKFDKVFFGPLEATGVASMMGMMDKTLGSGAYVALERIEGALEGRQGTFCVQHSCAMSPGKQEQSITVVPDSGTHELVGLTGKFLIDIVNGDHFYTFDYSLPG